MVGKGYAVECGRSDLALFRGVRGGMVLAFRVYLLRAAREGCVRVRAGMTGTVAELISLLCLLYHRTVVEVVTLVRRSD